MIINTNFRHSQHLYVQLTPITIPVLVNIWMPISFMYEKNVPGTGTQTTRAKYNNIIMNPLRVTDTGSYCISRISIPGPKLMTKQSIFVCSELRGGERDNWLLDQPARGPRD